MTRGIARGFEVSDFNRWEQCRIRWIVVRGNFRDVSLIPAGKDGDISLQTADNSADRSGRSYREAMAETRLPPPNRVSGSVVNAYIVPPALLGYLPSRTGHLRHVGRLFIRRIFKYREHVVYEVGKQRNIHVRLQPWAIRENEIR